MRKPTIPTRPPRTRGAATLVLAVALFAAAAGVAGAAPGDLDPSFDGDGKKTFGYAGDDYAQGGAGAAGRQDRASPATGARHGARGHAAEPGRLVRHQLRRRRDVRGRLRRLSTYGHAVALQPDGKIVVAGTHLCQPGHRGRALQPRRLARRELRPRRQPTAPARRPSATAAATSPRAVLVQPDGKIVVAGYGGPSTDARGHAAEPGRLVRHQLRRRRDRRGRLRRRRLRLRGGAAAGRQDRRRRPAPPSI